MSAADEKATVERCAEDYARRAHIDLNPARLAAANPGQHQPADITRQQGENGG
ncbi:hypothetical protein [Streptomyces sp. NPDC001492]